MRITIFTIHFVLLELTHTFGQLTDSNLYPFGPSEGDKVNPKADDGGSSIIPISVVFHFFETSYTSLFVNNNGVVSFGVAVSQYTPDAFPLTDGRAFVAPFWADVNNGLYGEIYYRESRKDELLAMASADVRKYFPDLQFTAKMVFVATWDRVAYYGSTSRKANTFQAVLITDGYTSFIFLNYGKIEWTTGSASGGISSTGLGGVPAQAGFNSGNPKHYFSIPGSRTSNILNIDSTSNVNYPGRWVFRADVFSVVGGCIYNARFLRIGDVFWPESNCERKCKCSENSSVICQNESCSVYEKCQPLSWHYICQTLGSKTCSASGDPHYYTFDGKLFHFQGTCTYVLSTVCTNPRNLTNYRVEVKNENRGNALVSWTRLVRVISYGTEITMSRDNTDNVMVNNIIASLPLSLLNGKIKVYKSGFVITVSTDFGMVTTYDGHHAVTVSVPLNYYNSTCGLCGTLTNDISDDFLTSSGEISQSDQLFAKSWKVPDNDASCRDECNGVCMTCSPDKQAKYSGNDYCGIISDPQGPFNVCSTILSPQNFTESCVYDLCATGGYRPTLCDALNSYSAQCQAHGTQTQPWRKPGFCEVSCPENSDYQFCATACPASCADSTAPMYCTQPCRESCVCSDGYILSGGKCVPLSQCGCQYQGRYYTTGEEVITNDNCSTKCRCINSNSGMECRDYACSPYEECKIKNGIRGCYPAKYGTCWASGDPHYYTFDGLPFDFQGTCMYTLSKYCGESNHLVNFTVKVVNEHRGTTIVSWTREVQLTVYNHQIVMTVGENGRVKADGSSINLPVILESGKIHIYHSGSSATVQTNFGLSLSYDWNHLVTLKLPAAYSGQLCGLCGNFNGDGSDDFIMPDGSAAVSALIFGNSWIDTNSSTSCIPTVQVPVCPEVKRQEYRSLVQCGIITNTSGPFSGCQNVFYSGTYFDNCVYDLCAMNGDHKSLCEAVKSYALKCQRHGITVGNWRSIIGCELHCPANSHYEMCGSSCPASCTNLAFPFSCSTPCTEVCQCDDGFVQSGMECVPLAQCGCTYKGKYYKAGEAFWMGSNCQQKCTCDAATNSVQCSTSYCDSTEICGDKNGIYGCHRLPDGVCRAGGDPHYMTFDRLSYDFQGTCRYVFAEVCNSSDAVDYFRIEVTNEKWVGVPVSVTAEVFIFVYDTEIEFHRGDPGTVKVNGIIVSLPVNINQSQIIVYQNGIYTIMRTSFGLTVHYDMSSVFSVTIVPNYRGKTCGLCGNFNGHSSDDFTLRSGSLASDAFLFASDWKTQDIGMTGCNNGCHELCPICSNEYLAKSASSCDIIKDPLGPFEFCHSVVDVEPFIQNCIYDVCLSGIDNVILCQSIQAYAGACQAENITVLSWRNQTSCEMQCPENSHYEICGRNCNSSCVPELASSYCDTLCSEGCFCNDGFLLSGDSCVPADQCGCVYNGVYHTFGDIFWTEGCTQKCNCVSVNDLRCAPLNCSEMQRCTVHHGKLGCQSIFGTCTVGGDPHYYTFDQAAVHFQGTCTYEIVKTCNHSADFGFSVNAENRRRGNLHVSYVSKVEVQLWSRKNQAKVILGASRTVQVNGNMATLPTLLGDLGYISQMDNKVVLIISTTAEIHYDGHSTLIVRVGEGYKNTLCGMCGNFNDDPKDDRRLPNGQTAKNDQEFGNAWKTSNSKKGCEDDTDITEPVCENLKEKENLCKIITEAPGPFADCHWHVNPMPYYTSCVYDLCHYGTANRMLCTAIGSYQEVCKTYGAEIQMWQARVNCSLQDPCETQMCTDSEWCGEYYGEYGCYCYDSFDKQTRRYYDLIVNCSENTSFVSLSRCLVFTDGIPPNALHLMDPKCTSLLQDGRLIFNFDSTKRACNTKLQVNTTHFIYSNAIEGTTGNNYGRASNRGRKISIAFTCEYPLTINISTSSTVKPVESVVYEKLSGFGTYQTKMMLYHDSLYRHRFSNVSVALPVNNTLYVGFIATGIDPNQFVITLSSCWITLKGSPSSSARWDLIINQCPNPKDSTVSIYEDGVSLVGRFSFGAFTFMRGAKQFYLHCKIQLCNIQKTSCNSNCLGTQPATGGREEAKSILTYGPIYSTASSRGIQHNYASVAILLTMSVFIFY